MEYNFQPVIIIGAGRSGTNMLRNVLTSLDGFASWDCDEINYIWRKGNIFTSTDALKPQSISTKNRDFIRKQFKKIAEQHHTPYVVEKTCANSLRVPFVEWVIPEAKYLFITRNKTDVTHSAAKRWKANLDLRYILKKARYVPFADLPLYAIRYANHRLHRFFSKEKKLPSWGPRYIGMKEDVHQLSLEDVCAKQWEICTESSRKAFNTMPTEKYLHIEYETFIAQKEVELKRILTFLHNTQPAKVQEAALSQVHSQKTIRSILSEVHTPTNTNT